MFIDVFRAFSAAAYAFAAGAKQIVLATQVDEAIGIAEGLSDAVLMGEVAGIRPSGFDLGNSPGEIMDNPGIVAGKTVVHRSSAGTRSARAAFAAGVEPLYLGSLVVVSATAAALAAEMTVTIVSSGESGIRPAEEDDICAALLGELLNGEDGGLVAAGRRTASCDRAVYLSQADFAHSDDVALCTHVDRFDFAMRAQNRDNLIVVEREAAAP